MCFLYRLILGLLLCTTLNCPGFAQINTCGVLVRGDITSSQFVCPTLFETGNGQRYRLDNIGSFQVGDRVNVTGEPFPCVSITVCLGYSCIANNTISVADTSTPECNAPDPFSLISPADNGSQGYGIYDWESTTAPNGGPITYKLIIAYDRDFDPNSIIYEKNGLTVSHAAITETENLIWKENDQVYWKVEATNGLGAVTSSNVHTFVVALDDPFTSHGIIVEAVAFSARGASFMQAVRSNAYQGNPTNSYSATDKTEPPLSAASSVAATATMLEVLIATGDKRPIEVIVCLPNQLAQQQRITNIQGNCNNTEIQIANKQIPLEAGTVKTVFFDLDLITRDGFEN